MEKSYKMKHLLYAAALILWATQSFAQSVSGPNTPVTATVRDLVQNVIKPAVLQRPQAERDIIKDIQIRIVPGGPFPGPRAGIDNGQRLVILPELFILQLLSHTEARIYALVSDQPYFAEWWLDYALWRSPVFGNISDGPFFRGTAPKFPLYFAGSTTTQALSFQNTYQAAINGMFNTALVDILLHELGHHALNRWYTPNVTPASQAKAIEQAADDWATTTYARFANAYPSANIKDTNNLSGRVFAIEYIFGLARWRANAQVGSGPTHPAHVSRIAKSLALSDCTALETALPGFCDMAKDRMQALSSQTAIEANYQDRLNADESFAAYRLGLIEFSRGDHESGCELMLQAYGTRASHYLGWCYAFSHIGSYLPDATRRQRAIDAYKIGADVGWADSIWGLKRLGAYP